MTCVTSSRLPGYGNDSPALPALPTELAAIILRFALKTSKAGTLASLSKFYQSLVYDIIYSVVILQSKKSIDQFHEISNSPALTHVKKLVIYDTGWFWPHSQGTPSKVPKIIEACTAIRILEVPTFSFLPFGMSGRTHPELVDLTAPEVMRPAFGVFELPITVSKLGIKRLRIPGFAFGCNPFVRPYSILSKLDNPEQLTHVEFSRYTNRNQVNDEQFVSDIANILYNGQFSKLQVVVVTIIGSDAASSELWKLLEQVREADSRLILIEGGEDESRVEEWKGFDFTSDLDLRSRFWTLYDRGPQ